MSLNKLVDEGWRESGKKKIGNFCKCASTTRKGVEMYGKKKKNKTKHDFGLKLCVSQRVANALTKRDVAAALKWGEGGGGEPRAKRLGRGELCK